MGVYAVCLGAFVVPGWRVTALPDKRVHPQTRHVHIAPKHPRPPPPTLAEWRRCCIGRCYRRHGGSDGRGQVKALVRSTDAREVHDFRRAATVRVVLARGKVQDGRRGGDGKERRLRDDARLNDFQLCGDLARCKVKHCRAEHTPPYTTNRGKRVILERLASTRGERRSGCRRRGARHRRMLLVAACAAITPLKARTGRARCALVHAPGAHTEQTRCAVKGRGGRHVHVSTRSVSSLNKSPRETDTL